MQGRSADHLDQRIDRWIHRGRDFVDGVAGARPGSRAGAIGGAREGERRPGWRQELDGLGRWVETRLDQLLDDEGDWREPWQDEQREAAPTNPDSAASRGWPPLGRTPTAGPTPGRPIPAPAAPGRRALDAISRRGLGPSPGTFSTSGPLQGERDVLEAVARPGPTGQTRADQNLEAWPDDDLFSVPRWRRPLQSGAGAGASARRPDLSSPRQGVESQPPLDRDVAPRPLPRSSRRRTP